MPVDLQAEELGEIAFNVLLPKSAPKMKFDDGYEIVRWPLYHNRISEMPQRGVANSNIWVHTFGYEIRTGRVMPTIS